MANTVLDKNELKSLKELQIKTNGFLFDLGVIENQVQLAKQSKIEERRIKNKTSSKQS